MYEHWGGESIMADSATPKQIGRTKVESDATDRKETVGYVT